MTLANTALPANPEQGSMRAMILAAGLGTRLKPWTDNHPKALAMVNGKSLLQRNIEYLQGFGIREVIVNIHHFADQIIEAVTSNEGWGSKIVFSDESGEVLETGGGLKKAAWWLDHPETDFLLMNVDILTDCNVAAMLQAHRSRQPIATLAVTRRETARYFLFDENDELCGWLNSKTGETRMSRTVGNPRPAAFSGLHLVNASIFRHLHHTGKFSMVDAYLEIAKRNSVRAFDHTGSLLIDVGRPESLQRAAQFFL